MSAARARKQPDITLNPGVVSTAISAAKSFLREKGAHTAIEQDIKDNIVVLRIGNVTSDQARGLFNNFESKAQGAKAMVESGKLTLQVETLTLFKAFRPR